MCSFSLEGFRFDKGPSLLLYPDLYAETFAELGRDIHDCIRCVWLSPARSEAWQATFASQYRLGWRVRPTAACRVAKVQERCYRVHFGDGTALDMLYDVQAMVSQLNHVEPGCGGWDAACPAALHKTHQLSHVQHSSASLIPCQPRQLSHVQPSLSIAHLPAPCAPTTQGRRPLPAVALPCPRRSVSVQGRRDTGPRGPAVSPDRSRATADSGVSARDPGTPSRGAGRVLSGLEAEGHVHLPRPVRRPISLQRSRRGERRLA